jgi:hypothetical protein
VNNWSVGQSVLTPSSVIEVSIVLCSVSLWIARVHVQSACVLNTRPFVDSFHFRKRKFQYFSQDKCYFKKISHNSENKAKTPICSKSNSKSRLRSPANFSNTEGLHRSNKEQLKDSGYIYVLHFDRISVMWKWIKVISMCCHRVLLKSMLFRDTVSKFSMF